MMMMPSLLCRLSLLTAAISNVGAFVPQTYCASRCRSLSMTTDHLHKGSVKFFDKKKGFGFIIPDDKGDEVFAHHSYIHMDGFRFLSKDDSVHYRASTNEKGQVYATDIYKLGSDEDLNELGHELEDAVKEVTLTEADAIAVSMEADQVAESIEAAMHDESTMTIESAREIAEVEAAAVAKEKESEEVNDIAAHALPVMAVEMIAEKLEEERQEKQEEGQKVAEAAASTKTNPDPFHHLKTMFKF
mmetsp:Transcript_38238/g.83947  ORF Transcript_38238/g.83947 Transcript_38238/m.83947 type:complete len:245 (-) Transcript_38238:372-1106(-)